jgi:D-3-phosphoglycerate dehydrogenase
MVRILAADGMEKAAVAKLREMGFEVIEQFYEAEELAEKVKEFDVLVVRSATKVRVPVIDSAAEAGRLKLIIRGGVGVDNIDVEYAESKGIKVRNTPAASSNSVAELALGHMFALARYIAISNYTMRNGEWNKKKYEGIELGGKTLGIVGYGRIGRALAKLAKGIGMNVIATDLTATDPEIVSMDELLAKSDFVSLHIPASKGAAPLINAETIAKMKDGAYLVNTARGALVDEEALLAALESGKLAGAALDVYAEEPTKNEALAACPKVSLTPHIGGSTAEAQGRIGDEIISHILEMFPVA